MNSAVTVIPSKSCKCFPSSVR